MLQSFVRQEQPVYRKVIRITFRIVFFIFSEITSLTVSILAKGVALTHEALLTAHLNFDMVHSHDVLLSFTDPYWIASTSILIWGAVLGATRVMTTKDKAPETAFRLIEKYNVSFMFDGAPLLSKMMQSKAIELYDLTSLRNYICVASTPPAGTLTKFNQYFPAGRTYNSVGMTETAGAYAVCRTQKGDDNAAGYLMYGIEAKVIDETGKRCGPNERGELYLKTRYTMLGYYNNPRANAETFDADGFLITGDIVYFDDKSNKMYMVDRMKDFIRYNFFHIPPSQIEAVLLWSPYIVAACVVGIPDSNSLELPAAAIIRRNGSKITADEIYTMIAGTTIPFSSYIF